MSARLEKSTIGGWVLLAVVIATGREEFKAPPLHPWHAAGLAFFLLLAIALIVGSDQFFVALNGIVKAAVPLWPFGKKSDGAP